MPTNPAGESTVLRLDFEFPIMLPFVPRPGHQIARLLLLRELGRGGMGVVYEARDTELDRHVAVKFMNPHAAGVALMCQRFVREARAAVRAECEHVVPILDFGEEQGVRFLVMPLLRGETLRDRLARERPLPLAEAVRIVSQLARGLEFAHSRGLVHRDVKPGNAWLDAATSRVLLMDFGLARCADGSDRLTTGAEPLGTFAYMAPEQFAGQNVDARADLFALGCVLHEVLVGELPFPLPACALLVGRPLPPLPEHVPAPLAALVGQLLAVSPTDRVSTAQAVIDALGQI